MILSINQLERLLIEVEPDVSPESVKEMVEAEISGAEVEQISVVDRFKKALVMGHTLTTVFDTKEGPFYTDKKLLLVTYRKDVSRQFKDALKKIEKARKEKEKAAQELAEKIEKEARDKKKAELLKELKELGVDVGDSPEEKQDRIDKALGGDGPTEE